MNNEATCFVLWSLMNDGGKWNCSDMMTPGDASKCVVDLQKMATRLGAKFHKYPRVVCEYVAPAKQDTEIKA